jgi:hypothetical protein
MKVALQLRQTPDLGAVDPQIGLDMGRRRRHGGKLNSQELGAPLQWGATGQVRVWSLVSQACMLGSVDERLFE